MSHFLDLLKTAVEVFFAVGGGLGLSSFLRKSALTQKNERIKAALTFSSQAVLQAQAVFGGGVNQQASAATALSQRLNEVGMGKYFTEEQMLMYIQQAYAKAKAEGTLDIVKPVVPAEALAEAEKVVTATDNKATVPTEVK